MEKCAISSTQLEVDEAILDYLIYNAVAASVEEWKCSQRLAHGSLERGAKSDLCLHLVESFLLMFRSRHSNHHASSEIRFRLHLLRFTSMFTARSALASIKSPSSGLRAVRKMNKERARGFSTTDTDIVPEGMNGSLDSDGASERAASLYPTLTKISLLDILPSFMALSAFHSVVQDSPITDLWMRLATGFMAHAALEQCLVHGTPPSEALRGAFAWGFDAESIAEEGSEDWQINAMFLGEDEEVAGWSDIKAEHRQALIPPDGTSLVAHAEVLLADELSLDLFERNLVSFIESLLDAQPKPLYLQLESGTVNGLSGKGNRRLQDLFRSE